jgi:nucleoid DNA-binding protein
VRRGQTQPVIPDHACIPLEVVTAITDTCWVTITEQLVAGEKVTIPSFGAFEVVGRSNWKGGPSTAKQKRLANFRAGKGLNEALTDADRGRG